MKRDKYSMFSRGLHGKSMRRKMIFLLVVVLSIIPGFTCTGNWRKNLESFFCAVDQDGDGEIEHYEAAKFMANLGARMHMSEGQANNKDEGGAGENFLTPHFDFSYGGKTISSEEMLDHLQNMLTADRVVNWITHGLQLPQYSEAFQKNAINGLDFLSLVENGSWILTEELGVSSPLHRVKITDAIVRQVFGFGIPPGQPPNFYCESSACGGIQLKWDAPTIFGYPPLHKYLIQRWSTSASAWLQVADTKEYVYLDNNNLKEGKNYSYRIQAWGGHGPSEWKIVENCKPSFVEELEEALLFEHAFLHQKGDVARISMAESSLSSMAVNKANGYVNKKGVASSWLWIFCSSWHWIFSLNGGLVVLGIISRQSFFFRITLAAWTVFKVNVIYKLHLKLVEARSSKHLCVRALAEICILIFGTWHHMQGQITRLSRQVSGVSSNESAGIICIEGKCASNLDSFYAASGYSSAEDIGLSVDAKTPSSDTTSPIISLQLSDGKYRDENPRVDVRSDETLDSVIDKLQFRIKQTQHKSPKDTNQSLVSECDGSEIVDFVEPELDSIRSEPDNDSKMGYCAKSFNIVAVSVKRCRYRCNFVGCKARFDRWRTFSDWYMKFTKHYCRECQRVFCVKHTRISPHGPRGQCGLDSNCICLYCFETLPPETRKKLEQINKLRVGPVASSESQINGNSWQTNKDPFPPDLRNI